MAGLLIFLAACVMVNAAPPSRPRYFPAPAQLEEIYPIDYYSDSQERGYETQQKHASNPSQNGAPARLETLDPKSEVELVPGAQMPEQPPQQNPYAPNIPGLIPGQRVFIVHMPIPGYSGYQPVYVLAAGPQGNIGYPGNGDQNGVLLDPAQAGGVLGYPPPGLGIQGNPLLFGGAPLNRPYNLVYQNPLAYQPNHAGQVVAVPLSQALPGAQPSNNVADPNEAKNGQVRIETKDSAEEERRNIRPAHQNRNKA